MALTQPRAGTKAGTENDWQVVPLDPRFLTRTFHVFAALAFLSAAISLGGKWIGGRLSDGGHTESQTLHEIVIGNNVLAVPANTIRFERARRDGVASRLDLYLRWPELDGYTRAARDDFNHAGGASNIIFLSFGQRMMAHDMSGRFEPIYRFLIAPEARTGPGGIALHDFQERLGYEDEYLAVGERTGKEPFVARCLSGPAGERSLAPCERGIHVGNGLSLTYRFPAELLGEWRALDAAVTNKAAELLQTAE